MSEHASLKQRIRQGDIVIGVSVPIDIEQNRLEAILGQDTNDFVSVDSQHSPYSEERLVEDAAIVDEAIDAF